MSNPNITVKINLGWDRGKRDKHYGTERLIIINSELKNSNSINIIEVFLNFKFQ